MIRLIAATILGMTLGAGGLSLAHLGDHGPGKVTVLSERDVVETLDGEPAKVTTLEVSYEPGESTPAHRHPGATFGYVLEGEFELALGDEPARTLKAGDTFYEPTEILHRVSRNPSAKTRTRVLAVILHPRTAKALTTMEPHPK